MGRNWGWTIGGACFCMLSAWGSAPKLTTLLPEAIADPIPMRIEASPASETRTDTLEWRAYGVRYQLDIPRTPNAPTRREFLCYTLTLERRLNRLPLFEWREAGNASSMPAPVNPRRVAVLVVGDLQGGYEFLQQIEYTPVKLPTALPLSVEPKTFPLTPIYLRPEQLPDHPAALLSVPFIVLTEGAERLSAAQQHALALWLHAGGQLIVPLGGWASFLRRTALAPYLPTWDAPRMQTLSQPLKLHGADAPLQPPRAPAPVARLSHPRGAPLVQVGAHLLAVRTPCGYGQLIAFGGDLTHPAWRNWQGQTVLWGEEYYLDHPLV